MTKTTNTNFPIPEGLPPNRNITGGRLIRWENGKPIPTYAPPLQKSQISDLLTAALSLKYTGQIDPETGDSINFDPRFAGMTNMEVIAIRLAERAAEGNDKATTELLDRILGKPKQSHETVGVRLTYQDFLKHCDDEFHDEDDALFDENPPPTVIEVESEDLSGLFDDDDEDDLSDIFGE